MQLHAHTSLWAEPAEWAGRLSLVIDPHDAAAPHVWAALANAHGTRAAHDGLRLAERALASDDPAPSRWLWRRSPTSRSTRVTWPAAANAARQLADAGRRLDDPHATVLGHVDQALALVYAGDHDAALPILDGLARDGLAPSDRAWILYAEGEALAGSDPLRSLRAFEQAIEGADDAGNRFLGGVARVSATSVHARSGEPKPALQAFAGIIDDWRRQGNVTHLVITLRNLVELFARVGAVEAAGELLGALQPASVTAAYGADASVWPRRGPRWSERPVSTPSTAGSPGAGVGTSGGTRTRPSPRSPR